MVLLLLSITLLNANDIDFFKKNFFIFVK